jgi:hypothetical protein
MTSFQVLGAMTRFRGVMVMTSCLVELTMTQSMAVSGLISFKVMVAMM